MSYVDSFPVVCDSFSSLVKEVRKGQVERVKQGKH